MSYFTPPQRFLEVRFSDTKRTPSLTALCAGYESGKWRCRQLAEHLIEWLPEFCLKYSEIQDLGSGNAVRLLKKAASSVYTTQKFENRGEVGEIILHAIIRQEFRTIPLVSKIYYKDSSNDTIKGFDCAHIVDNEPDLELWLGEAKFYDEFNRGARDVAAELAVHSKDSYLRGEFTAICNKLDDKHPASKRVSAFLDKNNSFDKIFTKMVIPVLITYDSKSVQENSTISDSYIKSFTDEVEQNYQYFIKKQPTIKPVLHLITVPLEQKKVLIAAFDEELRGLRW